MSFLDDDELEDLLRKRREADEESARQARRDRERQARNARLAEILERAAAMPEITDDEIEAFQKRIDSGDWTGEERELVSARCRLRNERPLVAIRSSSFDGRRVPLRDWWIDDLIPHRTVTILSGDGGVGKTILGLQLGAASTTETKWLGLGTKPGPVIYLGAEDELDELHRRLDDVRAHLGVTWEDLDKFRVIARAGEDALLATYINNFRAPKTGLVKTDLFDQLVGIVQRIKPVGVILDTAADIFGGDEINRQQVRQFIGILRGLAQRCDTAVVVLAHPSLSGLASGSGTSGSTAWNNSVRSRLYFEPVSDEGPNVRVLRTKKSNYGPVGGELRLVWQKGVFVPESEANAKASNLTVEAHFMTLLDDYAKAGRYVTDRSGWGYAPKVFAADKRSKGISRDMLRDAMNALFAKREIRVEEYGPQSRRLSRIIRAGSEEASE